LRHFGIPKQLAEKFDAALDFEWRSASALRSMHRFGPALAAEAALSARIKAMSRYEAEVF
jgi:hypothetical protein